MSRNEQIQAARKLVAQAAQQAKTDQAEARGLLKQAAVVYAGVEMLGMARWCETLAAAK